MPVAPARSRAAAVLGRLVAVLLSLPATPAAAGSTWSGTLVQAVAAIPTADESGAGYDRRLFPHWTDADRDCQTARAEVLIGEADATLTFTGATRCTVATGRWFSYYDRATWTSAADVDIDHVVALSEAWGSGAAAWTTERRRAYANDLGDRRTLVGVTDDVNQSKGDQDPSTWLPTYDRCRYVAEWSAVKLRWGLTADSAEKRVLSSYAASCSSRTVTVARA